MYVYVFSLVFTHVAVITLSDAPIVGYNLIFFSRYLILLLLSLLSWGVTSNDLIHHLINMRYPPLYYLTPIRVCGSWDRDLCERFNILFKLYMISILYIILC